MYRITVEPQDNMALISGTSLQGHVKASYYELVEAFGEPLPGDGYKTQAEWVVVFTVPQHGDEPDEDVVATIYDWKKYNQRAVDVTDWNVGGQDTIAEKLVQGHIEYLRANPSRLKSA